MSFAWHKIQFVYSDPEKPWTAEEVMRVAHRVEELVGMRIDVARVVRKKVALSLVPR